MNFKKFVFLFVVMLGCMSSSFAFSDLPNDHWAYNQVKIMQEKGIISGFTDGTFRPQNPVTREQFATILTKALELKETTNKVNFIDVQQDRWSKQYIDIASPYLTGYLNNGEYYFNPSSYAVREDMAVAVVKAVGLENETPDYTVLNKFTDKDLISDNLRAYIAIAVKNGIMNGNGNGTFNPLGNLTRAEITALMYNVTEKVTNEKEIEEISVKLNGEWYTTRETNKTKATRVGIYIQPNEEYILETKVNGKLTKKGLNFVATYDSGVEITRDGIIIGNPDEIAEISIYTENELRITFLVWVDGEDGRKELLYGDVNEDNIVDYKDSQILDETFEEINKKNADVDANGQVDWNDSVVLSAYVEGVISELPHTCGSYKDITKVNRNEQEHRTRYLCGCGEISYFKLEKHRYKNGKCECGAIEKNEIQQERVDNIDILVDNINNSRLLNDESMKLVLYLMGMQDFNISATKKSTNIITINNKDYNIENNILTFPIETEEDGIISSFILDSVAVMHGANLEYSEVSISNGSYSMAQNGFEVVDLEEITQYDPDTGWTSTFYTGTFKIDISKVPQI